MDYNILIQNILAGKRADFAPLVQHFQYSLFSYLGRMGFSQAQAEELAQETFLRAWQHLGEYDAKRAEFSTWLFTIAHRLALNELDRASTRLETPLDENFEPASPSTSPTEQLEYSEQQRLVQSALLKLPVPERSIIALAYTQGLDMKTLAKIENCTEAAIKVRLHRAKEHLRALLESA
ncbi:MAG: RNA polymerase sigma factor [Thiofilum sp.]|uniref:RNA polymerase sigma factor n=1 Tax=Thiofilum sp. TaxID=2212733 RepID=UPI0025F9F8FB|nr:RNA polymerase sigma factor [Thiofilum sp.]MBK8454877.1 RNA polymerase sigma factor [Thiofilum sp.]